MSKRFGRNQRRKLREERAALAEKVEMLRTFLAQSEHRHRTLVLKMDEWNAEIISLLGPYTALQRETPTLKVADIRTTLSLPEYESPHVPTDAPPDAMKVWTMEKLIAEIKEQLDPLRVFIRVKLVDREGESCLAMTPAMLNDRMAGLRGREIGYVAEQFATTLCEHYDLNHLRKRRRA